jgi:hypothetical protein
MQTTPLSRCLLVVLRYKNKRSCKFVKYFFYFFLNIEKNIKNAPYLRQIEAVGRIKRKGIFLISFLFKNRTI